MQKSWVFQQGTLIAFTSAFMCSKKTSRCRAAEMHFNVVLFNLFLLLCFLFTIVHVYNNRQLSYRVSKKPIHSIAWIWFCFLKKTTKDACIISVTNFIHVEEKIDLKTGAPEHMWTCGLVHTIFWDKSLKISYFWI